MMGQHVFAVIDTNVLVAAMLSRNADSATVRIVDCVRDGRITPVVNDEILNEYYEVLLRPKFGFDTSTIKKFVKTISSVALHLDQTDYPDELPDPKDRVFYEVSLTGDAYLVTGNKKHFPSTPKVVSPAEMLEILYI